MQPFDTYVVPISGKDFVRYIAIYSILSEENIKPNLILCASGGCFVSFMALMSDFTNQIENWLINSSLFIHKAVPFFPRLLTFSLHGHLYRRPDITEYVRNRFVPAKIDNAEIITGYFELSEQQSNFINIFEKRQTSIISTNKSENNSILKDVDFKVKNFKKEFLGDIEDLEKRLDSVIQVCENTTNIPFMTRPLGPNKAVDFGLISPSPTTFIRSKIKKSVYFSPIDIDSNILRNYREMFFKNYIINEMVKLIDKFENYKYFPNLKNVLDFLKTLPNEAEYCLVIFSTNDPKITLTSFQVSEVQHNVKIAKETMKFKLHW